jgi:hypothetical protein
VFIKGKEGTHHHPSILNSDSDSEVYPLQKFASLCGHKIIIECKSKKINLSTKQSFLFYSEALKDNYNGLGLDTSINIIMH